MLLRNGGVKLKINLVLCCFDRRVKKIELNGGNNLKKALLKTVQM